MKIRFNLFKKPKFPLALFIVTSLAALALMPIFILFLKSTAGLDYKNNIAKNDYLYLENANKEEYDTSDPFITKVPQLKDFIQGPIINGADPSFGSENAPVAIVEFSDFECEFCQKQEKIIKQIINEFSDKIRLIWKDYPESNPHSYSFQAAWAARCANEQNKFWQYHDLLFLRQNDFTELAKAIALNLEDFNKCLKNEDIKILIQNNIKEANALDITGVPFIYVNDKEIMGEVSYEELKEIVEVKLKKYNQ